MSVSWPMRWSLIPFRHSTSNSNCRLSNRVPRAGSLLSEVIRRLCVVRSERDSQPTTGLRLEIESRIGMRTRESVEIGGTGVGPIHKWPARCPPHQSRLGDQQGSSDRLPFVFQRGAVHKLLYHSNIIKELEFSGVLILEDVSSEKRSLLK